MGFIPGYENDIFISYSHIDNDPIIPGKPGWVDFFEDLLRKRLRVKLGGEIGIFRDPQLRRYGSFSDQLAGKLSSSAVFVCILSPRYTGSDWCLRELKEFCRGAGRDRIIKVVKTALDDQSYERETRALFAEIQDVLDYKFYKKDESSGLFTDLQPEVIQDHIPSYLEKIDAIAQNLVELLKGLRNAHVISSSAAISATGTNAGIVTQVADPSQVSVYLAETTRDLVEERNRVKTELLQFNCRVLPDQLLPQDADDLGRVLRSYLDQAKLSVHLIGTHYGARPEMEDRSFPHIQYEMAAEMSRARQLTQLVWMPDGITPKDASQQKFVDYLKNNSPEFLRTRLEDLKTEILKKLRPDPANGWDDKGEGDAVNVCLFCHEQDLKSVGPLYSHMTVKEMFKVKLPLKDAQSFCGHKQLLQASDAVLLYYGTADEDWFVNIWRLIQRHISAGRTKPMPAMGIYVGHPPTTEKDLLESDDLVIIKNYDQFTQSCLTSFVERIRAAKGGVQ
jgi:hypothetical protein